MRYLILFYILDVLISSLWVLLFSFLSAMEVEGARAYLSYVVGGVGCVAYRTYPNDVLAMAKSEMRI